MQIVELFGIIGGFFEVLWFVGLFLMGPYNRSVQEFTAVKEVYGESFLKDKTGFESFSHYLKLSFCHTLEQVFCLCGLLKCGKKKRVHN